MFLVAVVAATACKPPQPSAEYLAVCEGPPLRTVEKREQAMQDGHEIDRRYDCITKRSVKALAQQKAQWEAANTPEAKAARQAELERLAEEGKVRRAEEAKAEAQAQAEREKQWAIADAAPVEPVEINTATEASLAAIKGLGADVARQVVEERAKARFTGWDDVVHRVVGLSAAQTAVRASAFGLTVNGRSLEGAEPDSAFARYTRAVWNRRD
jgi:DNA uptake protein ComE-like DNA-binding protein